jgi:choline transport protein
MKDAGVTVPRAMIGSHLLNAALGIVFLISYLFRITSVDDALNDATGYPHMWVFMNTFPMNGVNGLAYIVILLIFAGTVSFNLSTSR